MIDCSYVFKKENMARLRILEWLVYFSSFYFLVGCLYAVEDVAELFVLLLLPWPFDAVRIATAVKRGREKNQI